ncbi:Required for respiratory growth protein 9 mitochondrial [Entomortierella lignicola]|nr:Required for respiratory growth protein 9 mitochondrial [Entomortierella lignicola]
MNTFRKSLLSSGSNLCNTKTTFSQRSAQYVSRKPTVPGRLCYSSSTVTTLSSKDNELKPAQFTDQAVGDILTHSDPHSDKAAGDAFSSSNISQEARIRWGLGATIFANIIFPKGRAEICDQTKKLMDERILNGHSVRRPPLDTRSHRSEESKVLNKHNIFSTLPTSPNPHLHRTSRDVEPEMPEWMKHRLAIKKKLQGEAWNPQRKLTRKSMEEVRFLHKQFPDEWTTPKLAAHFNVASESIVRILKTNFQLSPERSAEQDMVKQLRKKENLSADFERKRAARHAAWLELDAIDHILSK